MKNIFSRLLRRFGLEVRQIVEPHASEGDRSILNAVRPYTMTCTERLLALIDAVRYLCRNGLAGDIAECGVWRGGSMMAVALTLLSEGDDRRTLYLYDTFEGMPPPTRHDVNLHDTSAERLFEEHARQGGGWCKVGLAEVKRNLESTGYPPERIRYVAGKVEETIPQHLPGPLALLRLDTDWYESTRHELTHLYPLLVKHGVLILDDYGYWQGAKKATDEYFASRNQVPFLHRIDRSGRLLIKSDLT